MAEFGKPLPEGLVDVSHEDIFYREYAKELGSVHPADIEGTARAIVDLLYPDLDDIELEAEVNNAKFRLKQLEGEVVGDKGEK